MFNIGDRVWVVSGTIPGTKRLLPKVIGTIKETPNHGLQWYSVDIGKENNGTWNFSENHLLPFDEASMLMVEPNFSLDELETAQDIIHQMG